MMLHGSQSQSPSPPAATTATSSSSFAATTPNHDHTSHAGRKRKAEAQDNERLSKRLSLLNLEQNGSKLYVPVETPSSVEASNPRNGQCPAPRVENDDTMHLDDSKHKVYIYNIDEELSSDDGEPDDGRLVFLPDIDKHLKANRIPPQVLANSDGELAGMQMVLYSDPKSLSVPEEKDSVRKAVLEARHRLREKQRQEIDGGVAPADEKPSQDLGSVPPDPGTANGVPDPDAMDMD